MKVKELEKLYSQLKMEESYINDLCNSNDERVFNFAKKCLVLISPFQKTTYLECEDIVSKNESEYILNKDEKVFSSFKLELRSKLSQVYNDMISLLKKMYIQD